MVIENKKWVAKPGKHSIFQRGPVMETSVIVFTIYTKYGIIFATGILSFFSFLPRFGCFQIIYMLEIIGAVAGK